MTPDDRRSTAITFASAISPPKVPMHQPRAIGAVTVSTKPARGRTALSDLRQSGAMKLLFPRPATATLDAIVVNTAGGVTGGDDFALTARAGENTRLGITTQAAERAYSAQPGQVASLRNRLFVSSGARIDWLPQETILFDGCACDRRMSVELDEGAALFLVEPLVLGRAAMGEVLNKVHFTDRIDIRRQGTPLFLDAMALRGDVTRHFASPFVGSGAGALAILIHAAPDAEAHVSTLREMLPRSAGASLIAPGLLVARILAEDSFALRRSLIPILRHFTDDALPRCWMT